jgi:hypothetical protein
MLNNELHSEEEIQTQIICMSLYFVVHNTKSCAARISPIAQQQMAHKLDLQCENRFCMTLLVNNPGRQIILLINYNKQLIHKKVEVFVSS